MTEPSLRERVVAAMQARIDSGEVFQAKQVAKAGEDVIPAHPAAAECVMRRDVWGSVHTFINGEPVLRIADKLLQKNRKAGRIVFQAGWWHVSAADGGGHE